MRFEPTTSCIRGKRLTARPRGPHSRERTTPRLILNARWYLAGFFVEKYFQGVLIHISIGVVRSLPSWSSSETLAANAGGRGFESHRGQNLFLTFTLFYRVECEKLFCKTNIKLKE